MNKTIYTREHRAIANKLKKARIEAKLSQQEVATKLGKTQSYLSKIESGQRKINIIELKVLAEIYKKSLDFFVK